MTLSTVTTIAPNPAACQRARPQPVELEPLRSGVRRGDLLEREPGDGTRDVAGAEVSGRSHETDVAVGVHEPHAAARSRHHRHRQLRAEHLGRRVDLLVVDRLLRTPHELLEGFDVAAHRVLALGAPVDVVEQASRQRVAGLGPSVLVARDPLELRPDQAD
jgi:hypothetical protein